MRTNIDIDDALMAQVMRITGKRTKRDAIHAAMARLVERGFQDTMEARKPVNSVGGRRIAH